MSMISELVEELIDNADSYTKELHDLMYRAAETIEMLSEKTREPKHGKWIPCSERLPETRGRYLISFKVVGEEYVTTAAWGKPPEPRTDIKGNHFYEPDDEYGDFIYDVEGEVIAWMLLPEPQTDCSWK